MSDSEEQPHYSPLPPPVGAAQAPDYFRMNEQPKRFERLAEKLLGQEPHIKNVELYGIGGQDQYGIDVIGDRRDDTGREVVSCKCVRTANASDIKDWANVFLAHREAIWPDVKRFVLAIAAESATATQIYNQKQTEVTRFAALGIAFELWGPNELTDRLLAAPRAVARWILDDAWAERMHGKEAAAELDAQQVAQVFRLQGLVSDQVMARIDQARERLRAGQVSAARAVVQEVRGALIWGQLREDARAVTARLDASLSLGADDVAGARRLAEEALRYEPGDPRIIALVVQEEAGAAAGLAALGAPTTRAARQVRAGLLINNDQSAEALVEADALVNEDVDDAESQRLRGLALLVQGRREEALEAARRAEALAPHWLSVQRFGAIARYASSVSPCAPGPFAYFPNPIDSLLVRTDADSRAKLAVATDRFRVAAASELPTTLDELWRLACLANLPDRQADAAELARDMLARDPTDTGAAMWVAARNLDVDLRPSQAALGVLYASGDADEYQVRACYQTTTKLFGPAAGRSAIQADLSRQGPGRAAALEVLAHHDEIAAIAEDETEPTDSEAAEGLAEAFGENPPSLPALRMALGAATAGKTKLLLPYVDAILAFDTESAVNVAFFIAAQQRPPQAALDLYTLYATRFEHWASTLQVRRLLTQVRFRAGDVVGALALAEQVAAESGENIDRVHLANLHVATGHAEAALPAIRDALDADNLDADLAMRLSFAMVNENPDLARQLWRNGERHGIPDNLVVAAFSHAHRLGLSAEANRLMTRIQARAVSGADDVWTFQAADIGSWLAQRHQQDQNIRELYELGVAPIHVAAPLLRLELAQHFALDQRATQPGPLQPLLLRHGARPAHAGPAEPWADWRVHLDITGLMIADQLSLLPALRQLTKPVLVSRGLPEALYGLEQDVIHHQKAALDGAKWLARSHGNGRIRVQVEPAGEAETVRPERSEDMERGPTVVSVLRLLQLRGRLGDDVVLPDPAETPLDDPPTKGARLLLADYTFTALGLHDALDPLLDLFDVEVSQAALDGANALIAQADAGDSLADRIKDLRRHVGRELEQGRWKYLPTVQVRRRGAQLLSDADTSAGDEANSEGEAERQSPLEQSLFDIIRAPACPDGFAWFDDRSLSGYVTAGQNRIVGVLEVLDALVTAKVLTPEDRRRKRLQLRAGGAVFLPLDVDEVVAPLTQAPLNKAGVVIETPDLAKLRRNLSTAAALDPRMKIGDPAHPSLADRPDELPFLLNSWQILKGAILAVWEDPSASVNVCAARSDWLWANLRLQQTLRPLHLDVDFLASMVVASLYLGATHLGAGRARADTDWPERKKALAGWIDRTAIAPRVEAEDGPFLDRVTAQLVDLFDPADAPDETSPGTPEEVAAELVRLRQLVYLLAPPAIQQRLLIQPTWGGLLGAQTVVSMYGQQFPADALWDATARALQSGEATVQTVKGTEVRLTADGDGLRFSGVVSGGTTHPIFPTLRAGDPTARDTAIAAFLKPLDLSPPDAQAVAAVLAAATSTAARVNTLADAEQRSVAWHYGRLDTLLAGDDEQHSLAAFMPPPMDRLRHHLRLAGGAGAVAERVRAAWPGLVGQIGLVPAFLRMSGLPIDVAGVLDHVASSDSGADEIGDVTSPMMAIHLAALTRRRGDDTLQLLLEGLLEQIETDFVLLVELLSWSQLAFQSDPVWREADVDEQAAVIWFHAHRVTAAFTAAGLDPLSAAEYFREARPMRTLSGMLFWPQALRGDAASPSGITPVGLLFNAMGYIFGGTAPKAAVPDLAATLETVFHARPDLTFPQLGLLMRRPSVTNLMGGFLKDMPVDLPGDFDLTALRQTEVDRVLTGLEATPTESMGWAYLMLIAEPGEAVSPRVDAIFDRLAMKDLMPGQGPLSGAATIYLARRLLGGPINDHIAHIKLAEAARHLGFRHRLVFDADDGSPAARAFGEIVELCAAMAQRTDRTAAIAEITLDFQILATHWPAAAPALRDLVDAYVRRTAREDSHELWEGFLSLRRWR